MWIISTIFSIISIICYYQNIKFLIIIGAILVIVDNILNTIYGKQTNLVNLFISIFGGILFSLIFNHNILYFTSLVICSVNIIEGVLGILLLIFGAGLYKQNSKVICPHCNSKNNSKREICYMCGKKIHEEKNTNSENAFDKIIEDNFSNNGTKTYINDIKVQSDEIEKDSIDSKLTYILDMLKREIGIKDVDDAIHQLYKFYVENDIDIPNCWISYSESYNDNQKLEILLKILQTGMGTSNIDDTIQGLEEFYKEQHTLNNNNNNNINEISTTDDIQKEIDLINKSIKTLKQTYEQAKKDLGDNTIEKAIDLHERGIITENQKNDFIDAIEGLNIIINNYPSQIATLEDKLNQLIKEKESIYCIYCGTKSNIKDKYCNNCGKELKK